MSRPAGRTGHRRPFALVALTLALAVAPPALAQGPASPAAAPAPAPTPIPLVEIAIRADEVAALLAEVDADVAATREIRAIETELPGWRAQVQASHEDTMRRLDADPPLAVLDGLAAGWTTAGARVRTWTVTVTRRATQLQQEVDRLATLRATWARSRSDAVSARAPVVVVERIDQIETAISSTKARLESRLAALLVLQHRLSQDLARCDQTLARIVAAREGLFDRLMVRGGPPIWSAALWTDARGQLAAGWREGRDTFRHIADRVIREQAGRVPLLGILFLVLLAVLWRARGLARGGSAAAGSATLQGVFQRPVSAALVLAALAGALTHRDELWPFLYLAGLVLVVPVLRLMRPLVEPAAVLGLYAFGVLFVFEQLRLLISTVTLLEHVVYLVEMLGATLLIAWLRATGRVPALPGRVEGPRRSLSASAVLLLAFATAFVAGALGYTHLARLIGTGALGSSYAGLAIAVVVLALRDLAAYALRARPLRLLRVVQLHRGLIEQRVIGVLRVAGTFVWAVALLHAFALLDAATAFAGRLLALPLGWGAIRVSLGDLLAFGVSVWAAVVVARLTRFVLEEDVFSRVRLSKGLPQALSSMAQYGIVTIGVSLALVALGVEFTKLTIVFGALGVGVGFGLQNVVNNVASGLILLFERAVRIGDAIRIGDVEGEVQAIGVRSSTVRTGDGAEVIVPNAEMVSQKVANWTFSDRRRRVDVSVRVAYGTAPDRVSRLVADVARAHPKVLVDPAPLVLFQSLGDGALLFELRCWTDDFDAWGVIRSELTAGVYRALEEARITIPLPQRAVRVTMEGPSPPPPAQSL